MPHYAASRGPSGVVRPPLRYAQGAGAPTPRFARRSWLVPLRSTRRAAALRYTLRQAQGIAPGSGPRCPGGSVGLCWRPCRGAGPWSGASAPWSSAGVLLCLAWVSLGFVARGRCLLRRRRWWPAWWPRWFGLVAGWRWAVPRGRTPSPFRRPWLRGRGFRCSPLAALRGGASGAARLSLWCRGRRLPARRCPGGPAGVARARPALGRGLVGARRWSGGCAVGRWPSCGSWLRRGLGRGWWLSCPRLRRGARSCQCGRRCGRGCRWWCFRWAFPLRCCRLCPAAVAGCRRRPRGCGPLAGARCLPERCPELAERPLEGCRPGRRAGGSSGSLHSL